MPNVNTRALVSAELQRTPRAMFLTADQRAKVLDTVVTDPNPIIAGGNLEPHIDRAIDTVLFGRPLAPLP